MGLVQFVDTVSTPKSRKTNPTTTTQTPKLHKAHQHLRRPPQDNGRQVKDGHLGIYSISVIEVVGMQGHPLEQEEQVVIRGLEEGQMNFLRRKTSISMVCERGV